MLYKYGQDDSNASCTGTRNRSLGTSSCRVNDSPNRQTQGESWSLISTFPWGQVLSAAGELVKSGGFVNRSRWLRLRTGSRLVCDVERQPHLLESQPRTTSVNKTNHPQTHSPPHFQDPTLLTVVCSSRGNLLTKLKVTTGRFSNSSRYPLEVFEVF